MFTSISHFIFSVKPDPPVITINQTSAPHREGDHLQLTCSTTSGNPSPGIRWFRNGDVLDSGDLSLPDEKFGTTSSTIVRLLSKHDHQANYSCTAENEANIGLPVMNSLVLQVQCKYSLVLLESVHFSNEFYSPGKNSDVQISPPPPP